MGEDEEEKAVKKDPRFDTPMKVLSRLRDLERSVTSFHEQLPDLGLDEALEVIKGAASRMEARAAFEKVETDVPGGVTD